MLLARLNSDTERRKAHLLPKGLREADRNLSSNLIYFRKTLEGSNAKLVAELTAREPAGLVGPVVARQAQLLVINQSVLAEKNACLDKNQIVKKTRQVRRTKNCSIPKTRSDARFGHDQEAGR